MIEVELGDSGLRSAPIGFGCAAMLGRSGRKESLRALAAAWDEGIRLFDTARSYGYGESEGLLGEFLLGRREQAVIATKFGILPGRQSAWKSAAKAVARTVLKVIPSARAVARKGAGREFTANQFTLEVLRYSVETSLRELKTDRIDILYLHSAPPSVLEQDDLLEAVARMVEQGKVRLAGLSGEPEVVQLALQRPANILRAMQFPCNLFSLDKALHMAELNKRGCAMVANHPFGGVMRVQHCREKLGVLASKPELDKTMREKLAHLDDSALADVVFNVILRGTGIHAVVPAMMRVEHVRTNVRALTQSRFNADEIAQIRGALCHTA